MSLEIPEWVREEYMVWSRFLTEQIDFSLKESRQHTKEHCARVLLFCLLLAHRNRLGEEDREALAMAACFHDARRQDDWLDVGHGARAAAYYRDWCRASGRPFDLRVSLIMAYHDRDDALGAAALRQKLPDDPGALVLYRLFKDADGLDRFRLGPDGLDVRYLRTEEAGELVEFSKRLLRDGPEGLPPRDHIPPAP